MKPYYEKLKTFLENKAREKEIKSAKAIDITEATVYLAKANGIRMAMAALEIHLDDESPRAGGGNEVRVTVPVNQQLDLCGDEFLDERDFEIEFCFNKGDKYITCVIDGMKDCIIKKEDLLSVLRILF
jgi:hypothetical protein